MFLVFKNILRATARSITVSGTAGEVRGHTHKPPKTSKSAGDRAGRLRTEAQETGSRLSHRHPGSRPRIIEELVRDRQDPEGKTMWYKVVRYHIKHVFNVFGASQPHPTTKLLIQKTTHYF